MKNKIFYVITTLLICNFIHISAQTKNETKILVTYFSVPETEGIDASSGASRVVVDNKMYGATEYIAKIISELTGGKLFEIKTVQPYPTDTHKKLIDYAKKEADEKIYPKLASKITNFDNYDIVFIGYPNWWYDMPMVIYSLLEDYNFSGKTIIPFCTHGGSGFSQSVQNIKELAPNSTVNRMPAISRNNITHSRSGIEKWLKEQGLIK